MKTTVWQSTMIALARNDSVRRMVQGNRWLSGLATRFIGGRDSHEALERTLSLAKERISVSFFYLGEYVDDLNQVEENVAQKVKIIQNLREYPDIDLHVSVDPSQIGYAISEALGEQNAFRIGRALAGQQSHGRKVLMLDMEDYSYVDKTMKLRERLASEGIPTAITIQAMLRRSEQDIRSLVETGAMVRLVKGAFVGTREHAFTRKREIDDSYLRLGGMLLCPEAKAKGVYPVFATHDEAMANGLTPLMEAGEWKSGEFEFEMLFGVRKKFQRKLVADGHNLRLYLPFGTEWWPYTARRIGENSANMKFVMMAIFKGD